MGTRWLDTLRRSNHALTTATGDAQSSLPEQAPGTSWRAWLATGARPVPVDRRRGRGMDDRVKNVLLGGPSGAVDFPSAMARQTVDEAMSELPSDHRQVVKLAYFSGLTNREIAMRLGLTVGGVRRRLRQSLATIGAYVERGRATGRRAVHGLAIWFTSRNLDPVVRRSSAPSVDQVLQGGAVVAMTVTAAILITHHNPSAPVSHPHQAPRVAAVGLSPHSVRDSAGNTLATVTTPPVTSASLANAVHQATSIVSVPINVQLPSRLPVRLPKAPSL